MKHRVLLRRALPAAALAAVLLSASLPASALLFRNEEAAPTVAAFSKNGPVTGAISFTQADFRVEDGKTTLDSIVISSLPDPAAGALTLGGQAVGIGDVVTMNAVDGLRFTPLAAATVSSAAFSFVPIFSDGRQGSDVSVGLYLLAAENSAPIAENLELSTYKNVAITAQFAAVDPEGDLLTFHIVGKPARGAVTLSEDGSGEFVYTPYENKTGKDSFTYVAVDTVGNSSDPATVKIRIAKADTKVTYADLSGHPAHKAAIRLAEEGIFVGERMGAQYFFQPDTPVTRSQFVAMAMECAGAKVLEGVERTGFYDDDAIPTWAKGYVSSALKSGLVQGSRDAQGRVVFNAGDGITRAEAAVLLDRALQVTDVSAPTMDTDAVPTWASQSAANLATCGVLPVNGSSAQALSEVLTRGEAAQMLCAALELMDNRDNGGWLQW